MTCPRCISENITHLFDEDRYDPDSLEHVYTWSYWRCNECRLVFIEEEDE